MKLDINNLTKKFGEQVVLDNLSLNLNDIHSLVIIGPSGGGKSTLLKIIAGLEFPQGGDVGINEEFISFQEKTLREYRKTIGVVFQAFNLFPHLSALKNITLPLEKVHLFSRKDAEERALSLFEKFQLKDHVHKKPFQLSGGQQQRVAIIRAMALDVKFFLLDEPTSALDPSLTSEVLDTIRNLRKERKDFILITHEMGFAKNVADYIIFIDQGKVLEHGTPKEMLSNPKTEELRSFLGKTLKY